MVAWHLSMLETCKAPALQAALLHRKQNQCISESQSDPNVLNEMGILGGGEEYVVMQLKSVL